MRSIRANMLRAILTMLIIGFGIMALVGILTAIDAIRNVITSEFSRMGGKHFFHREQVNQCAFWW